MAVQRTYSDWYLSDCRLLSIYRRIAWDIAPHINRPKQQATTNPLDYATLYHPLPLLQKELTCVETAEDRRDLIKNPDKHLFLNDLRDFVIPTPMDNDVTNTDPDHAPTALTTNAPICMSTPTIEEVYPTIISLLQSTAGRSILGTPQMHRGSCLTPDLACITACRKLRVPIMRHLLRCKCDKDINMWCDHSLTVTTTARCAPIIKQEMSTLWYSVP